MMMNKIFSSILLLILFTSSIFAQEVEFPLSSNPVIKEYLKKNPVAPVSNLRIRQNSLPLPFEDDFSGQGIYPNTQLWMDSDAFVNQTYCDNPITIGVATLDGIDKYGNPHDSNSTSVQAVVCDYLTSKPIDLSAALLSDSIYFSFYYQPQGLGDEPEDGDSLVLQFYNEDSTWINMWVANGKPDTAFQESRMSLLDTLFFWSGFQFRFYNYANANGNRDHWNIDYVSLKANESAIDPLKEISLVNPVQSYLKEYTAMPYTHYKSEVAAGTNQVKDSISDIVKLYDFTGTTSLHLTDSVWNAFGSLIFADSSQTDLNPSQNTTDNFQIPLAAQLFDTSASTEYTDFTIKHSFSGLNAGAPLNDASYFTQHFQSYYAYDDGTAESATGVHVAYTKYAYQFDIKKQDTLRGVQIYFNPWGINVHQDLFSLCLWSNVNVSANTETLVHQTIDQKPENNDSVNGFVNYFFDGGLPVSAGTIYVGIIQSSIDQIGIGVDHNTDSHDKMFLSYNNQWYASTIHGSWMMRPLFGSDLTIGVNEIAKKPSHFNVYPNPADKKFGVRSSEFGDKNISINIYNVIGEKVLTVSPTSNIQHLTSVDVSTLPNGIYFVHLSDDKNSFSEVKKLLIQH